MRLELTLRAVKVAGRFCFICCCNCRLAKRPPRAHQDNARLKHTSKGQVSIFWLSLVSFVTPEPMQNLPIQRQVNILILYAPDNTLCETRKGLAEYAVSARHNRIVV